MKARINQKENTTIADKTMSREDRRALKKKLASTAREVAKWERIAVDEPARKSEAESAISAIMDRLTLMEMMALQDYIMSKGLLEDNFNRNKNINTNEKKENESNGSNET